MNLKVERTFLKLLCIYLKGFCAQMNNELIRTYTKCLKGLQNELNLEYRYKQRAANKF